MTILETKNLQKVYGSGETAVHALRGVDLNVQRGEFIAVVGTSGSGKSTLLHMLGGLDRPTAGEVIVDGKSIFSLKDEALTIFRRRKIGFIFQNYNLVPVLNVYENIVLPIICPDSFPVASSREWRLQGLSPQSLQSFWRMSRREIWTPAQARMLWDFSRLPARNLDRQLL